MAGHLCDVDVSYYIQYSLVLLMFSTQLLQSPIVDGTKCFCGACKLSFLNFRFLQIYFSNLNLYMLAFF